MSAERERAIDRAVIPPAPSAPAIAATFAINLLSLALPLAILQIFDRVVPHRATDTLLLLTLGLFLAIGLDFALKTARALLMGAAAEAYERRLLDRVTRRALAADPERFDEEPALGRFERFAAVAQLREHAGGEGRLLAVDLAFVSVFAGLILQIGGWLVLVPATALLSMFLISLAFRRVQFECFDRRRMVDARRFAFLGEFLERIATVKAHRLEAPLLRRYEMLQDQAAAASRRLLFLAHLSQSFGAVFGQAATAAMALFGGWLVIRGDLGLAELAACTLLNGRALQPMMKLIGVWSQAEGVAAARRKVAGLAALPPRVDAAPVAASPFRGEVAAREIALRAPGGGAMLFEHLSFHVPAGGRLAITGDDGSGKTSLLRLLLGELTPSAGKLLIDGAPAVTWRDRRGRDGLVYVDRRPVVFQGTILENLAPSGAREDVEAGLAAAAALGLDEEIRRLPHGYETPLGHSGGASSLNLLQRVSLARALALKPRILLFNEANTAMDRPSDEKAREALSALLGETTLILVTRRPAWIALTENVVRLAGPVEEPGVLALSFAEMRKPGRSAPPPYRLSDAEMVKASRSAAPARKSALAAPLRAAG